MSLCFLARRGGRLVLRSIWQHFTGMIVSSRGRYTVGAHNAYAVTAIGRAI